MNKSVKEISLSAMFIAMGIIIPLAAGHAIGLPGTVLLPMHFSVFIAAMLLGPKYGALIGFITPILSCLLTGMPNTTFVFIMTAELTTYGLVAGFLCKTKKLNVYPSLLISMIIGRVAYAISLFGLYNIFGFEKFGKIASVFTAISTGIPGIILQIIIVPLVVLQLRKVIENVINSPKEDQE